MVFGWHEQKNYVAGLPEYQNKKFRAKQFVWTQER